MTETPTTTDPSGDQPGGYVPSDLMAAWLAAHPGETKLLPADIAGLAGIRVTSLNHLNSRSRARRRAPRTYGHPRPGDLPPAHGKKKQLRGPAVDYWLPAEIDPWLTARTAKATPADDGPAAELIPALTGGNR